MADELRAPAMALARKARAPGKPRAPEKKMKEALLKAEAEEPLEEAEWDDKKDADRRRTVRRFYRKLEAREGYIQDAKDREASKSSPDTPILELEIGKRAQTALEKAGIIEVGQALELMTQGDMALLEIDNFGRKSLSDLKRRMKSRGFVLPEFSEEPQV